MPVTATLLDLFMETRDRSERLCDPLQIEDYVVQPIVDVSPPKWHLGHTTWFFEEFILKPHVHNYQEFDPDFSFVFNSYYENLGKRVIRANRGNLSRPSVALIYKYREYVTNAISAYFENNPDDSLLSLLEIGIHHEKQHQELLLTDIKYILGNNPLMPSYDSGMNEHPKSDSTPDWIAMSEGLYQIGHRGDSFCFDNELGRHQVFLGDFEISDSLVTNKEYLEFLIDGGYRDFNLWHSEAWDWVNQNHVMAPMYWHLIDGDWFHYTLGGLQPLSGNAPVTHLSYFEAYAYAQWKGFRLPTEFEWEAAQGQFQWGDRWEWTESAYLTYPGFSKAEGALGEYNGKFMVNQKVLRGGSIATPQEHTRPTYRNFFQPQLRWQYTGLRLAR